MSWKRTKKWSSTKSANELSPAILVHSVPESVPAVPMNWSVRFTVRFLVRFRGLPDIGNFIIPINIFQRGGPTTNQYKWDKLLNGDSAIGGMNKAVLVRVVTRNIPCPAPSCAKVMVIRPC